MSCPLTSSWPPEKSKSLLENLVIVGRFEAKTDRSRTLTKVDFPVAQNWSGLCPSGVLSIVDIPEPLSPTIAMVSPGLARKLTFLSVGSLFPGYVNDRLL